MQKTSPIKSQDRMLSVSGIHEEHDGSLDEISWKQVFLSLTQSLILLKL